jgi:hypothetical protein
MAASLDGVRKRSKVHELSPGDTRQALVVARSIGHPWYRCQALSNVAAYKSRAEALALLNEAFAAANEQTEINRVVTVSSWPLRVLVPLDPPSAKLHLTRLVQLAQDEPHGLRRADALNAICSAAYTTPELRPIIVPVLIDTLLSGRGWRIERLIRDVVMLIHRDYPELADKLLEAHPPNRRKRKLEEALSGETAA